MSDTADIIRLFVTGGSGFIGTNVIERYLAKGASIMNADTAPPMIDAHNPMWRELDILDRDGMLNAFSEFKPTHVLHLAARTDLEETSDIEGYDDNITGTQNVIDAIKSVDSVQRAIITSTMFVNEPGTTPKDDFDYNPHTVYGQSKVMTEKITIDAGLGCIWSITRPAVIWGPYHERLRHGFFSILSRGLYFHPGNTKATKSYGYVGNSVYQIESIFQSPAEQVDKKVFYLADPPIDLLEWGAEFSRQLINKELRKMPYVMMKSLAIFGDIMVKLGYPNFPMTSFRLNNMTRNNIVNTNSINAVAPDLPYTYKDGIRETVKWLRSLEQ